MSGTELCQATSSGSAYAGPDPVGDAVIANLLEALGAELDADTYFEFLALDQDHAGIMALWHSPCPPAVLRQALHSGASCLELLEAAAPDQPRSAARIHLYGLVRVHGHDHATALAALAKGVAVIGYADAVAAGATHQEILEYTEVINRAHQSRTLKQYAACLQNGYTHPELLAAFTHGITAGDVLRTLRRSIPLADLIAALSSGQFQSADSYIKSRC